MSGLKFVSVVFLGNFYHCFGCLEYVREGDAGEFESHSGEACSMHHYAKKSVVSPTKKTDLHDITETLLNTITLTLLYLWLHLPEY